ncbi:MAG: hypothetical protein GY799_26775 [Desulfobulbaceae bacterium]|nr:hypothetical protein [Desulfobulbaceae bacterium]
MKTYIIEAIRRVVLVGLMLVGVWFVFTSTSEELVIVKKVNFKNSFDNYPYFKPKDLTLEKFKDKTLKDRNIVVSSPKWEAFFEDVISDRSNVGLQKLSSYGESSFVFSKQQLPEYSSNWQDNIYVGLEGQDVWLSIKTEFATQISGLKKTIKYPMQSAGFVMVIAGLVFYAIIPRYKPKSNQLYYNKWASVIVPDLLGVVGACFFIALSIRIICENEPGYTPLTVAGSWLIITFIFWIMAAIFLAMVFVAQHYANLTIEVTSSGLIIYRGSKKQKVSWNNVKSCAPYRGRKGLIIGILLILVGRTPGAVGQGLLVATNQENGVEFIFKDGSRLKVMLNHLVGAEELYISLQKSKITGSKELQVLKTT